MNRNNLLTPKGVISVLAALSVICSFILSAPAAAQFSASPYGGAAGGVRQVNIPGLEGLTGFVAGENQVSLATYMVSQDGDKLYFEVVGMAISSPYSPQSTVYTMKQPLMGVLDRSVNTIQIDMSGLAASIGTAGMVDKASLYNALRSNENVFIINLGATYTGTTENQVLFDVNSVSIIPPDGNQEIYSLQQPMQLVIDTVTYRMSFPSFPELADDLYTGYDNYMSGYYTAVEPVLYPVPVPVTPVVFVPVYIPVPIVVGPAFCSPYGYGDYGYGGYGYGDYGYGGYGYGGYGGYCPPYAIPQTYYSDYFTPSIYVNQFAIAAAAASAAAYGGDAYGVVNDLSPYVYGGGGAAAAAASAAASAGVDSGGIAAAAAAAAAASSGYDVSSATASAAAASGGFGSASAAAAAASAAVSAGADYGGAAASAAAAAAAASGGNVGSVSQAIANSIGTPGASAAAAAAAAAASGGADYGGVAASAAAAAAAASNGDPITAVQRLANSNIDTPGVNAALDAANTARQSGIADPPAISRHVQDAAIREKGQGPVATPVPKTKPLASRGPAKAGSPAGGKTAGAPIASQTPGSKRGAAAPTQAVEPGSKRGMGTASLQPGTGVTKPANVPARTHGDRAATSPSAPSKGIASHGPKALAPGTQQQGIAPAGKTGATHAPAPARGKTPASPSTAPLTQGAGKGASTQAPKTSAPRATIAPAGGQGFTSSPAKNIPAKAAAPVTTRKTSTPAPGATVKAPVSAGRSQMQPASNPAAANPVSTAKPVTKAPATSPAKSQTPQQVTNTGKKPASAGQTKAVQPAKTSPPVSQPKTHTPAAQKVTAPKTTQSQPKVQSQPQKTTAPAQQKVTAPKTTQSQPKVQSQPHKTTVPATQKVSAPKTTQSQPKVQSAPQKAPATAAKPAAPKATAKR